MFSLIFRMMTLGLVFCSVASDTYAQTIAEKKAGVSHGHQDMTPEMLKTLQDVNRELKLANGRLYSLYSQVNEFYEQNQPQSSYAQLLVKINDLRQQIINIEENWRQMAAESGKFESYALWHQPETTIGQLVMDYGSQDYVYLVPHDIANIKLSVDSNIPIPRASWEEMLDLLLAQNGVGYNQLNPYLRQLFLLKDNKSGLKLITNERRDLDLFAPQTRICFVLTPEFSEVRRTWLFLEKFVNSKSTILQQIGRDILIIGQISDVQDLLKLNDFVAANKGEKEYRIFPLRKVDSDEMAKILAAIFDQAHAGPEGGSSKTLVELKGNKGKSPSGSSSTSASSSKSVEGGESNGLKVIALSNIAKALFLVGTKEEIKKAEEIIRQVEGQVGEAHEKEIFWYTAKHTDAEELADILQKVYLLLIKNNLYEKKEAVKSKNQQQNSPFWPFTQYPTPEQIAESIVEKERSFLPSELYEKDYYQQGAYAVNPAPTEPKNAKSPQVNKGRENFIVDPKTSSIAMVVEADILPKLKDLIKKLDVAKRMVQIETLLFERRLLRQNNFGLNLLKIGSCASQTNTSCLKWNENGLGLLDFFLSGKATTSFPAYDMLFRFLMTQDDIQINSSPTIVATNQTPATIAIVEEISINMGIYDVETAKGVTLEKAFTRTQYGIWINITPMIHMTDWDEEDDEPNYVTLETDITFDTIQPGGDPERPDVTRRKISNEVRVPDGQTVILGGLRRKIQNDSKEAIPFLGELPAIGKFFSMQQLTDAETEMFIFLTPTIISDPLEDFERIKCEEMRRRPGDIPEFLCCLTEAIEIERNRVLVNSMELLLGPEPDRCHSPAYWRPSNCGKASWIEDFNFLPPCGEYNGW